MNIQQERCYFGFYITSILEMNFLWCLCVACARSCDLCLLGQKRVKKFRIANSDLPTTLLELRWRLWVFYLLAFYAVLNDFAFQLMDHWPLSPTLIICFEQMIDYLFVAYSFEWQRNSYAKWDLGKFRKASKCNALAISFLLGDTLKITILPSNDCMIVHNN